MGIEVLDPILRKLFAVKGDAATGSMCVTDAQSAPGRGAVAMPAAGVTYTSGRWFQANTTVAGAVTVTFADGSSTTLDLQVGTSFFPLAIVSWSLPANGAATASFANIL